MSLDKSIEKPFELALKYLKKYRDTVGLDMINQLFKEYVDAEVVLEPTSAQLSEAEQDELFMMINSSNSLSAQEKVETIIGLLMVLNGSFPNYHVLCYMKKVFGAEFVEAIEQKREENK